MTPMPRRPIGSSDVMVGALGLGCMGISSTYAVADDLVSLEAVHTALDLGMTMLDTADLYGNGHNERLLRSVLATRRDDVFIATKFGFRFREAPGGRTRFIDSSARWARTACEASMSRLGVEHIDLFYLHRRNPDVPIEETMGELGALVDEGKIGHIGLSEVSPPTLRAAARVRPVAAVQMEYSLFTRDVEDEMAGVCRDLGTSLVAYAPMGRGLLTGSVTDRSELRAGDARLAHPRFGDGAIDRNVALVDEVRAIADEVDATPAQVALAWLLAQGSNIIPIPGTTKPEHVRANAAAAEVRLTSEQIARLSSALPAGVASGERHDEANLQMLGR